MSALSVEERSSVGAETLEAQQAQTCMDTVMKTHTEIYGFLNPF